MKNFVSVVFSQKDINEKQIVESMLSSANMALMESYTVYGLFESDNNNLVLKLRLDRELSESESDKFAQRLADKLFDQGYDDFDIEVSVSGVEIYEQTTPLNLNDYKRQIEAAGPFTVSANGMNVTNRDTGGYVAGVNQNGNLWSGSQVITDIVRRGQTDARQPTGPGQTTSAPTTAREPSGSLSAFAQSGQGGIANNPEESQAISELQDRLRAAGFDPGATDGRYGPNTANAVRQFQQSNNLSVDGDAGPQTINLLLAAEPEADPDAQPAGEPESGDQSPVPGAPEPRSDGSVAADPDNTGNAEDPEAQPFTQDTPSAARQLFMATRRFFVNQNAIFRVMSSLQSPEEWAQLQQDFLDQYDRNLLDRLESRLNSRDMIRYVWDPLGRIGVSREDTETQPQPDDRDDTEAQPQTDDGDDTGTSPDQGGTDDAETQTEPEGPGETQSGSENGMNWSVTPSGEITIGVGGTELQFTIDRSQAADGSIEITTEFDGERQTVGVVESETPELYAALTRLLDTRNESISYSNPIIEAFEIDEETFDGNDFYEAYGELWFNEDDQLDEAEYQGRKVKLGKPMRGDVKKFKVYVRKPNGKVVKVNFGDPDMKIKKSNPKRRKSFRARHNCDNPGPRWKARYWSCRAW